MITSYRLVGRVDEGDISERFRGLRREREPVLIELFRPQCADAAAAGELARAASVLRDAADATLFPDVEVGWVRGRVGLVREGRTGFDLRVALQRLRSKDVVLAPNAALSVILALLDAMEVAHRKGLLHGGVEPRQIWLSAEGRVGLSGFGLPEALLPSGMLGYRAPELAGRAPKSVKGDVFALGAIAYELLTLHLPLDPRRLGLAVRRDAVVTAPSRVDHRLSSRLDPVLLRAVDPDPKPRYRSCAEFAASLRAFLTENGGLSGPEERARFVAVALPNEAELALAPPPFAEPFELEPVAPSPEPAPPTPSATEDWEAPPAAVVPRAPAPAASGPAHRHGRIRTRRAEIFEAASEPEPEPTPDPHSKPLPLGPEPLRCPNCQTPMRKLVFKRVDVGRCPECFGVWLVPGAIDVLAGRAVPIEPAERPTERLCAACRGPLGSARLNGDLDVERCANCGGLFLDAGELDRVLGRKVTPEPPGHVPPAEAGFDCVKCGRHFPMREGNVIASGLACPECTPQVQTTAAERAQVNRDIEEKILHPDDAAINTAKMLLELLRSLK